MTSNPADFAHAIVRQQALQFFAEGQFESAMQMGRQVLKQDRRDAEILFMLGQAARCLQRFDEATDWLKKCQPLAPGDPALLTEFGQLRFSQGRFADAMSMYDKALRASPGFAPAMALKAGLLEHQGKYEAAGELLRPLIDSGTADEAMAVVYARVLNHEGRSNETIALAQRYLADPASTALNRLHLLDSMAKAHEKLGEIDKAFDAFAASKQLQSSPFDVNQFVADVDALIEGFSSERFSRMTRSTNTSELPVFIASMPRSGSTLVEQILAAHPQVYGAGEIEHFQRLVRDLPAQVDSPREYPECIIDLTREKATQISQSYLREIAALGNRAKRIVNKHLDNWRHVGLIALLMPKARIIHVKRDPLDNCFSCFTTPVLYPYASDFQHLGLAYRQYERLMNHWRDSLHIPMLEVHYEELIESPEPQMRRLIEFAGLEWHERCLRFHEFDRPVMTLSYDQVRKPIYKTSIRRCEKFMHRLGPLKAALSDR